VKRFLEQSDRNQSWEEKGLIDKMSQIIEQLPLFSDRGKESATLVVVNQSILQYQEALDSWLHPEEQAASKQMKYPRRRNTYLMGRIAAKQALCALLPHTEPTRLNVKAGVFGQPVVTGTAGENLQVSITHIEQWGGGLAFHEDHPMGIDIENPDAIDVDVVASQCTTQEKNLLRSMKAAPGEACAIVWTMKESLSKVLRSGLTSPLDTYEIHSLEEKDGHVIGKFTRFAQYQSVSFSNLGLWISVTLPKRTRWDTSLGSASPCFNGVDRDPVVG
jgi:phosphopantetheinyl transferase